MMESITWIGLLAAFCTTVAFIPQALKVIRTKHTKDLSLSMYSIFTTGVVLWLLYGITIKDLPMILANSFTLAFALVILFMKIKHK